MKRLVLFVLFFLGVCQEARGYGLYYGAAIGRGDPEFKLKDKSCASDDQGCYPGYNNATTGILGWPGAPAKDGYNANAWAAGLDQTRDYKMEKGSIYSIAVGWDFKLNPFRMEAEYSQVSSKAGSYIISVFPGPGGQLCQGGSNCKDAGEYAFDLAYANGMERSVDVNSYMVNGYFEIPGFGNIDPYLGAGVGMSKLDTKVGSVSGGSKGMENTMQLIAGVEYRVPDSPFIVGLEYRSFSMKNVAERDDADTKIDFKHKYVLLKFRYDPINGWLD